MQQSPSGPATFCAAPADYIVQTYFVLRMVIAGGTLLLPVALLVWVAVDPELAMMGSLSAFYYSPARGLFVGILVAIGVALVAYRGYTRGENALLNAAGGFSILVALFPTGDPAMPGPGWSSAIHAGSAVAFFVAAALSIVVYGQQTLGALADPALRRRYRVVYRVLAVLVVAFPALAVLLTWVAEPSAALFAGEAAALWSFAIFWLLKTYELARSHGQQRVV